MSREINHLFDNFDPDNCAGLDDFIDALGNLLGLNAFRWISYDSLYENIDTYKDEYPDLISVTKD